MRFVAAEMNKSPDCKNKKCNDGVLGHTETRDGKFTHPCPLCFADSMKKLLENPPPRFKPDSGAES